MGRVKFISMAIAESHGLSDCIITDIVENDYVKDIATAVVFEGVAMGDASFLGRVDLMSWA